MFDIQVYCFKIIVNNYKIMILFCILEHTQFFFRLGRFGKSCVFFIKRGTSRTLSLMKILCHIFEEQQHLCFGGIFTNIVPVAQIS